MGRRQSTEGKRLGAQGLECRFKKKRAVEREVRRLNADRPMLSEMYSASQAVKMLVEHIEKAGRAAQSRYDSDRYGSIVRIHACIGHASRTYVASYSKWSWPGTYDDVPIAEFSREFATLRQAVEWIENKAAIPFADFHR